MSIRHVTTDQKQAMPRHIGKKGNEMSNVKRQQLIWGVLLCLAVMLGSAAAQNMTDYEYITRYLDVSQGTWVDENGDGYGEGLGYDVNGNGYWDAYRFSTFANGYLNVVVFDTSGNESFSSAKFYMDTTGSGRFNAAFLIDASGAYVAVDPDEDSHYTGWFALVATPSPTPENPFDTTFTIPPGGGSDGIQLAAPVLADFNKMIDRAQEPACNGSLWGCR